MSGVEDVFAPGLVFWQEQKDFVEDDSHHLVAEGDPFDDMLAKGTVVIRGAAVPRPEDESAADDDAELPPGD